MDWLLTAIVGGFILFCAYLFLSEKCRYWEKRGFPHIPENALIMLVLIRNMLFPRYSMTIKDGINWVYKFAKAKGYRYLGYNALLKPQVLLLDPDLIYDVLVKDFSRFVDRPAIWDVEREPLTDHLFTQKGDVWRTQRYKMAPAFTTGKLRKMLPHINDSVEETVSTLGERVSQTLETTKLFKAYTLNVIGSVAFGMKVEAQKHLDGEPNEFVERAQEMSMPSATKFLPFLVFMFSERLARLLDVRSTSEETSTFFTRVIKDAIRQRQGAGPKRTDFLQLMIEIKERDEREGAGGEKVRESTEEAENPGDEKDNRELLENWSSLKGGAQKSQNHKFTDQNIAANSFGFLSGGSETAATIIAFAIYEIARNPHVQAKIHKEIDEKISNGVIDFDAVSALTYLEQVLSETLRKHAPVATLNRISTGDYRIPGTDDVIRKGQEVVIPVMSLHNDPDNFPDPDTFDPERFSDPSAIRKGTYLPFGLGPRFCIAKRFALLKMKTFIARTMMVYSVKMSPKTKLPMAYTKNTLIPFIDGGLWVEFEARK